MMTKINNWLDKPWTNRTYLKFAGWGCVISAIVYAVTFSSELIAGLSAIGETLRIMFNRKK